ncbi:MAG TPA: alpha/beta hydrolase [Anaerolineales bacterium]|nr:alpha/beta hydrolase [Anaerolineales bacterium]
MILTLSDKRKLAYEEYGDPQGTPVFFIHGAPGSRLFHPPDEVTKRQGVRLICTDRPGYGDSTFQPNRQILDWATDIAQLAKHLGFEKFGVIGHSGGGPHALACAYVLSEQVTAAAIISGAGPADTPKGTDGMFFLNWLGFKIGRYTPWFFWYLLVKILLREIAADPAKAIDRDKDSWPPSDRELLTNPEIRELCIRSDLESYRHGLLAFAWDAHLIIRPWGFELEKIKVPTHLWHGTLDNSTTFTMARYMEEKIPNCKLTICEDEAHMLLIPHWEDILVTLKQMSN